MVLTETFVSEKIVSNNEILNDNGFLLSINCLNDIKSEKKNEFNSQNLMQTINGTILQEFCYEIRIIKKIHSLLLLLAISLDAFEKIGLILLLYRPKFPKLHLGNFGQIIIIKNEFYFFYFIFFILFFYFLILISIYIFIIK